MRWRSKEEVNSEALEINASKKDPSRFEPLYNRYFRQIFRFIYKRTEELELTSDITSQVFLKALINLPNYQVRGIPFSTWLYRIASNEIANYHRKLKKERIINYSMEDLSEFGLKESDEKVDSSEFESELILLLNAMPPQDVELVELRFFEKMPFRDIAQIKGLTEVNAKIKVYRILERMKKKLNR